MSKKKSPITVEEKPQIQDLKAEKPTPLTLDQLYAELTTLKQTISDHATLISQLQESLARKRRPVASNGKIQIRDKQTGKIYPSKNNCYQSLLKSGEVKAEEVRERTEEIPQ